MDTKIGQEYAAYFKKTDDYYNNCNIFFNGLRNHYQKYADLQNIKKHINITRLGEYTRHDLQEFVDKDCPSYCWHVRFGNSGCR